MSTSRLLISIVGLTALLVAVKMAFQGDLTSPSPHELRADSATGLGGGSAASVIRRVHGLETELAALRDDLEQASSLRVEMRRLEEQIAAVGALAGQQQAPAVQLDDSSSGQSSSDGTAPPADIPSDEATHVAAAETAFISDAMDPQWSASTSALITGFFDQDTAAGGSLRDVDCRSKYCRVVLGHQDPAVADTVAIHFAMHVARALPEITYRYEHHDDGFTDLVMYLAKAGVELPSDP